MWELQVCSGVVEDAVGARRRGEEGAQRHQPVLLGEEREGLAVGLAVVEQPSLVAVHHGLVTSEVLVTRGPTASGGGDPAPACGSRWWCRPAAHLGPLQELGDVELQAVPVGHVADGCDRSPGAAVHTTAVDVAAGPLPRVAHRPSPPPVLSSPLSSLRLRLRGLRAGQTRVPGLRCVSTATSCPLAWGFGSDRGPDRGPTALRPGADHPPTATSFGPTDPASS